MRPRQPLTGLVDRAVLIGAISAGVLTAHSVLNHALLRKPAAPSVQAERRPSVSILIPARDEAERIGPTLRSALLQRGVAGEVVVLDDRSRDGTTAAATRAAEAVGQTDLQFHILQGRPLPTGWLGKPNACAQLGDVARGDVLVFLDADVVLEPDAVAAAVDLLTDTRMDLLSPYPRQVVRTAAERLVQPLLQWSWLTFLPLRLAEHLASPMLTAANGQLIVCRAEAYRAAGGHLAVRTSVLEDIELARAFKVAGRRVGMADGTQIAACQMYDGWGELRDGYTKSLWLAFGSRSGAAAVMALLAGVYVLPPLGMVFGLLTRRWALAGAGAAGYALGTAGRAHSALRTGGRPGDAIAHPVSVVMLIALTVRSFRLKRRGLLTWKGRAIT